MRPVPSLLRSSFLWLFLAAPLAAGADSPPAFPGAVGQGAAATGGRGGDVYHVVNLDDYKPHEEEKIPGSLRHAIRSAEGPRTIVFDVAGAIALHAPLEVLKSNLTIAGQTAPPPGVTLWGYPFEITDCSDVVVRHLRVRLGDFHAPGSQRRLPNGQPGNGDLPANKGNAVYVGSGAERVVLDHVSASWGMDETLSVTKGRDVTIQHCLIAASLNDSFHSKGDHGYGTLVRGELTPDDQRLARGGYTFFGNLWHSHRARNPSIGGQQSLDRGQDEADRRATDVNLVNNVIYNWGENATHRSQKGTVRINLVGNYYICGPAKKTRRIFRGDEDAATEVYHAGNFLDADRDERHDGEPVTADSFDHLDANDSLIDDSSGRPFAFFGDVNEQVRSAPEAYQAVVANVGASLDRDAVDQGLISQLQQRSGELIDSQEKLRNEAGVLAGLGDMQPARRPADFDTDGDGMADDFERQRGLDPSDAADRNGRTLSDAGYTNLEVYLDWLTQRQSGDQP